nr:unnamed protein product [Callosobruchus chinensis]
MSGELLPLLPCLYLMQSKEGQFDLPVTLPLLSHLQPLSHRRAVDFFGLETSSQIVTPSQAHIVFGFWNSPADLAMMPHACLFLPSPSVTTNDLPMRSGTLITLSSNRKAALPSSEADTCPMAP